MLSAGTSPRMTLRPWKVTWQWKTHHEWVDVFPIDDWRFSSDRHVALPETNIAPEIGFPKGNDRIPTIHFQVQTVSFGEGSFQGCTCLGSGIRNLKLHLQFFGGGTQGQSVK